MPNIRNNAKEIFKLMLLATSEPASPKHHIIDVVMPMLDELGFSSTIYTNNGCPAVYAETPNPQILLSGHLDTVELGNGWNFDPAQEVEGKIYGRGSLDMKGPCLSMLIAAEQLISEGTGCAITFTTDEEVGMDGAKVIAKHHPEISSIPLIIIFEPTGMKPVIEEKGLVQFKLTVHGISAHGSMPELGKNAIMDLYAGINALFEDVMFGQHSTAPTTLSIGKMSGGMLVNMVADRADAEFDIRHSPDFTASQILKNVKLIFDNLKLNYDLEIIREIKPARSGLADPLLSKLEKLFGPGSTVPYATEMAVFCELNQNIFILGPGEPGRAHKPDEFMTMEEIFEGVEGIINSAKALSGIQTR